MSLGLSLFRRFGLSIPPPVTPVTVLSSSFGTGTNTNTWPVSWPSGRQAGDVAVVFAGTASLATHQHNALTAGWTKLTTSGDSSTVLTVFYRVLDGTADDDLVYLTQRPTLVNVGVRGGWCAYVLQGVENTGTFIVGGATTSSSKQAPAVDGDWAPSGAVFLNALVQRRTAGVNTPPTTYGDRIIGVGIPNNSTSHAQVEVAHKVDAADADTPGAWVYSSGVAGDRWYAASVAVKA